MLGTNKTNIPQIGGLYVVCDFYDNLPMAKSIKKNYLKQNSKLVHKKIKKTLPGLGSATWKFQGEDFLTKSSPVRSMG